MRRHLWSTTFTGNRQQQRGKEGIYHGKPDFMRVHEVAEELGVSMPCACKLIRQMNEELKKNGCITISGQIDRKFFHENLYGTRNEAGRKGNVSRSCRRLRPRTSCAGRTRFGKCRTVTAASVKNLPENGAQPAQRHLPSCGAALAAQAGSMDKPKVREILFQTRRST